MKRKNAILFFFLLGSLAACRSTPPENLGPSPMWNLMVFPPRVDKFIVQEFAQKPKKFMNSLNFFAQRDLQRFAQLPENVWRVLRITVFK